MKENKGKIVYQFLPEKYSKCPYCGSNPESYRKNSISKWEETVHFKCGLSVRSRTPIIFEEFGMCKNSKKWKSLQKNRLKQLEKIKIEIKEKVKDKKLYSELMDKMRSVESNVKNWWND